MGRVRGRPSTVYRKLAKKPTGKAGLLGLVHRVQFHPHALLPLAAPSVYPSYSGESWGSEGDDILCSNTGWGSWVIESGIMGARMKYPI